MANRDFEKLAVQIRLDTKNRALQQALLVPWRRLAESAAAYADWHIFVLWVRVIAECGGELPEVVQSALNERCAGFLDSGSSSLRNLGRRRVWQSLEEWIGSHHFLEAKIEGWFDAVVYYAYKDLRTEQAWTCWEGTKNEWSRERPVRWPIPEEWRSRVLATHALVDPGTEKGRAVEALAKVDAARLQRAVLELVDSRAFALWISCISEPDRPLPECASKTLGIRHPSFLPTPSPMPVWRNCLFLRLVRFAESDWRGVARAEQWAPALKYQLRHHPRYHRIIHYARRCQDEWLHVHPRPEPTFTEWLAAADQYCVAPVP